MVRCLHGISVKTACMHGISIKTAWVLTNMRTFVGIYAVLEEASGRSKGCGLVEYSTRDEAQIAIAQLTNSMLGDRMIFVREDREPEGGSISDIVKRTRTFYPPNGGVEYYPPPPPHFAHQYAPPPALHHPFLYRPPPMYAPPLLGGGGERQIFIGNVRCLSVMAVVLSSSRVELRRWVRVWCCGLDGMRVCVCSEAASRDALEESQGAF